MGRPFISRSCYELESTLLKGRLSRGLRLQETTIGDIQADTRSLDYGSYGFFAWEEGGHSKAEAI